MKRESIFRNSTSTLCLWGTLLFACLASDLQAQTNCLTAPTGLVSLWRGEGSGYDSAGTNIARLVNNVTFSSGEVGQAFVFDGISSALHVPANPSLDLGTGAGLTIECWIKPTDATLQQDLVEWNNGQGVVGTHFAISVPYLGGGPGSLWANIVDTNGVSHAFSTTTNVLGSGVFQHVALTYNKSTGHATIYWNGRVVTQTNVGTFTPYTSSDLYVAWRPSGPFTGLFYGGAIDELALYNRELSINEVQSIYSAGGCGKCPIPPRIVTEPASQVANAGNNASFGVLTSGDLPLAYQWLFNGSTISGATNPILALANVQVNNAGTYSVVVSNLAGTATSGGAVLAVNPVCVAAPSGLVSWWRGEGNAFDSIGSNNAAQTNGITYVQGLDGLAFNFDGSTSFITVPGSPSLNLSNLTFETWIFPTDASTPRPIFEYAGATGLSALNLWYNIGSGGQTTPGALFASARDAANSNNGFYFATAGGVLPTNQWSHVALAFDSTVGTATLYLNGTNIASYNFGLSFHPNTQLALNLGYRPIGSADLYAGFKHMGKLDEVSVYSRALSANEINAVYQAGSAGKCQSFQAPMIVNQPTNQTSTVGGTASFSVVASGNPEPSYQWLFGGIPLPGATGSTLSLNDVQSSDAGAYAVIVSNASGSVTSSIVTLTLGGTCVSAPSGLVSWWQGEGNAFDSVGSNNAIQTNGITYVPGLDGIAFNYDGSTSLITVPASPSLSVSNLTIETWIFPTDGTTPRPIFEYANDTGLSALNFWYNIGSGAQPVAGALFGFARDANNGNNNFYVASAGGLIPTNKWTHVAFAFDSAAQTGTLYINGTNAGSVNFNVPVHPNTSFAVNIGYRPVNSADLYAGFRHKGKLDEVSLYNRSLSAAEINAIYQAGSAGKCTAIAPSIFAQPTSQSGALGDNVSFSVLASGTAPLSYQWFFDGVALPGAGSSMLTLSNVQPAEVGSYSVVITNSFGSITSLMATLSIPTNCVSAPPGIVSWWQAESNAIDFVSGNNGQLQSGAGYGTGRVGMAFSFDGLSSKIDLGDPLSLAFTNSFSIEGWIWVNGFPPPFQGHGLILFRGDPRFCLDPYYFAVETSGHLRFHIEDAQDSVPCGVDLETGLVATQQWIHVAAVFDGSNGSMQIYTNGALAAQMNTPVRPFQTLVNGGTTIGNLSVGQNGMCFNGLIDELSAYSRALLPSEVQEIYAANVFGKCSGTFPPVIAAEPANVAALVGDTVNFAVTAGGTSPLSYQWFFGSNAISGATASSLVLSNVTLKSAGSYFVVVTNVVGAVTSSPALLSVAFPAASVQLNGTSVTPDGTVTVPVSLLANGNENAASFSLNFDPTLLTFDGAVLGNGALSGSLLPNLSQVASGKLGLAIALPAGTTLNAGTQQVATVTFTSAVITAPRSTTISFGDTPLKRLLADASGAALPANFVSGNVLLPPTEIEGDAYPRPNGDGSLTISDWVLVGRYVAGLDSPTNALEFQRADCAPRSTLGDGALTVSDWVQAGRYAAGLDPVTRVGGPTSPVPMVVTSPLPSPIGKRTQGNPRQVRLIASSLAQGQTGAVQVSLEAQGNENALAFSLSFDPTQLVFAGAAKGNGAAGTTLNVNANQASQGRLGFVLGLNANQTFAAGSQQLIQVNFRPTSSAAGGATISFADQPVPRGICDPTAETLAADYINSSIAVSGLPSLKIGTSNKNVTLSWPASAAGYLLQESTDSTFAPTSWTTVTATPTTSNNETTVSVPASSSSKFYRLYHP